MCVPGNVGVLSGIACVWDGERGMWVSVSSGAGGSLTVDSHTWHRVIGTQCPTQQGPGKDVTLRWFDRKRKCFGVLNVTVRKGALIVTEPQGLMPVAFKIHRLDGNEIPLWAKGHAMHPTRCHHLYGRSGQSSCRLCRRSMRTDDPFSRDPCLCPVKGQPAHGDAGDADVIGTLFPVDAREKSGLPLQNTLLRGWLGSHPLILSLDLLLTVLGSATPQWERHRLDSVQPLHTDIS